MRKHSRKLAVLAGFVAAMTVAGVAFAAWTSSGNGSGHAHSTAHVNSVIAADTNGADLYPGATKSFTVTISNPNPYPVIVTSIGAGSSDLVNTTCTAGSVTSDARNDATGLLQSDGVTKTIAASGSGTYTLVSHMIANPDQACESQTFNLPLTAGLQSNA